jgi:hypothetical protein
MPIVMLTDNPQGTEEIYEKVRAHLGLEGPAGGIFHCAGPSPKGGWRVIEVWETQEDAMRFREERLFPAFEAAGLSTAGVQPEFWPVHNIMMVPSPQFAGRR